MTRLLLLLATIAIAQTPSWPREAEQPSAPKPAAASPALLSMIGEYGTEAAPVYVLEQDGQLWSIVGRGSAEQISAGALATRPRAHATAVTIGGVTYPFRHVGPADGGQLRVTPLRPVPEILAESMKLSPPTETGTFRPADLVELTTLDPAIHLEIRYATTNNFLGSRFYSQGRAFMQRPAAEAVVRAQKALKPLGYGLMIHDGYRPWFVTKTFWEATPQETRWLVADPAKGSKHNRGCAVDLTLYDLKTGRVIEMPSTYDESTPRAFAFYPGGTGLQRWHRALLRRALEAEGFAVNPEEWWHFDYKDWQQYSIGNVAFDKILPPRS